MYDIQHCFICRPSYSTESQDAGIEPRDGCYFGMVTGQPDDLTTRLDLVHILQVYSMGALGEP